MAVLTAVPNCASAFPERSSARQNGLLGFEPAVCPVPSVDVLLELVGEEVSEDP
jgi:hypothetical protein